MSKKWKKTAKQIQALNDRYDLPNAVERIYEMVLLQTDPRVHFDHSTREDLFCLYELVGVLKKLEK